MKHDDIYIKYLNKLKIEKPTTLHELESVFLLARNDFFDFKISLDQISSICGELLTIMQKDVNLMTSHLESVLSSGAELSWYIRQRPDDDAKQLNYFLQYNHDYKKET